MPHRRKRYCVPRRCQAWSCPRHGMHGGLKGDDREPRGNKGNNRDGDERRCECVPIAAFFSDTSHSASNVQDARRPNLMRRIAVESTYVLTSETHLPIQENYPIISRNREGSKSTPRMAPAASHLRHKKSNNQVRHRGHRGKCGEQNNRDNANHRSVDAKVIRDSAAYAEDALVGARAAKRLMVARLCKARQLSRFSRPQQIPAGSKQAARATRRSTNDE